MVSLLNKLRQDRFELFDLGLYRHTRQSLHVEGDRLMHQVQ